MWSGGVGRLLRGVAPMAVAAGVTHVANYLFQIVCARSLPPAEYGALNALLAAEAYVLIPMAPLAVWLARECAAAYGAGSEPAWRAVWALANRWHLVAIGVVALMLTLLSDAVGAVLGDARGVPAAFWLAVLAAGTLAPGGALIVLQATQRFDALAFNQAFCFMTRVGLAAVIVWFWAPSLNLILVACAIAGWSRLPMAWIAAGGFPLKTGVAYATRRPHDLGAILLGHSGIMLLSTADLIWVNRFFPGSESGYYAAASMLAKVVLYLPMLLGTVVFPAAAALAARRESGVALIRRALLATLVFAGVPALFLLLFPDVFIRLLFGEKMLGASAYLPLLTLAMLPMAAVLLLKDYFTARGRVFFNRLLAGGGLGWLGGTLVFCNSIQAMLVWFLAVTLVLLAVGLAFPSLSFFRPGNAGADTL